jgi:hypothetical protein
VLAGSLRPRALLAGLVAAFLTLAATANAAIVAKPAAPLASARLAYVPFQSSPFPYRGIIPDKQIPFLDAMAGLQWGHTAPRPEVVYWENQTYSDRRSLIYFPRGFDIRKPAVIVVFFHGNQVILERDVVGRQQVPQQLAASGLNAVLLAPQFAVDALDSSAGTFWTPGVFSRYLDEAAGNLASVYGDSSTRTTFARMPVVFVAFSGGYDPAAYALKVGGVAKRVKGVVLLDSPYDYESMFADFITQNRSAFFFSAYSVSAADNNELIKRLLAAHRIPFSTTPPEQLSPGVVSFVADPALGHGDFVTNAWVPDPVAWALTRIPGYPR